MLSQADLPAVHAGPGLPAQQRHHALRPQGAQPKEYMCLRRKHIIWKERINIQLKEMNIEMAYMHSNGIMHCDLKEPNLKNSFV